MSLANFYRTCTINIIYLQATCNIDLHDMSILGKLHERQSLMQKVDLWFYCSQAVLLKSGGFTEVRLMFMKSGGVIKVRRFY
jgi:hypothetical protein